MQDRPSLLGKTRQQQLNEFRRVIGQTRAVDGPRKFTSVGDAVFNRLVQTTEVQETLAAQPVTSGLTLAAPVDVVLTADYKGVYDLGQFPFDLTPVVKFLDADFLTDPRVTYVIETDGVTTTAAGGVITVTGMTKLTGYVRWIVSLDGVQQKTIQTNLSTLKDPDPVPPVIPDPLVTVINKPVQNATSSINTLLADFGSVPADTYDITFVSAFVQAAGYVLVSSNCQVQLAILPPGDISWTFLAPTVDGNPTFVETLFDDGLDYSSRRYTRQTLQEAGSVTANFNVVIPTPNTRVALWGKLLYGSPVNFLNSALLEN